MRKETLTGFALFISLLFSLQAASCRRQPEDIIADLQEQITELPADPDDRQEAIEELLSRIEKYENEENEKRIQVLIANAEGGLFEISGDGLQFAARTKNGWTVLSPAGQNQFSAGDDPESFTLSFAGRYIVYSVKENDERCRYGWIDLGESRTDSRHEEDFIKEPCSTPVIPTDDGSVYISRSNDIYQRNMYTGQEKLVLGRAFFKPAFPKISNRMFMISVPGGVWLLFGAAGHYDLYHYAGVPGTARKVYPGIASPLVQPAAYGLFTESPAASTVLFLYTGEAGRYRLQGFTVSGNPWKSFQIPVRRNVTYLMNEDQFLYVRDAYPIRYVPSTGKESRLPLRVRRIFAHGRGLIYLDERNRLLLRTEPYSEYEKKLFQMKEELEHNLRQ
jgi:hypothetical protein